ncbi:MAG: hydrolase [Clostridia bacterium]|nr:hydrolase [Clostridia bacterium]
MRSEILIQHDGTLYYPPIADGVDVEWDRKGQPGKMTFEVIKTDALKFDEGDACRFNVDDDSFFFGFVFDKSRQGSEKDKIKVTVYDQLFYLRNKDYFLYSDKTATEVIRCLAADFGMQTGDLENTGFRLPGRAEDNQTLFDIIQNALDDTLKATGKLYVLYDKSGRLTLTECGKMKIPLLIDESTAADYDYKTSISDSYNKIRLQREGETPVIVKDSEKIRQWGVLQYVESVTNTDVNLQNMAKTLLTLYGEKKKMLSVKKALGSIHVRAGSLLVVRLDLGDDTISNYLLVEQVKHSFRENEHFMDLKLRGNGFVT